MSISDDLANVEGGPTWEEILHKLLKEEGLILHTQVDKPEPMTALDVAGDYWGKTISPGLGKLVVQSQLWKRRNMVSYKRERSKEIISGIKGQAEQEKKNKSVEQMMLGLQR